MNKILYSELDTYLPEIVVKSITEIFVDLDTKA